MRLFLQAFYRELYLGFSKNGNLITQLVFLLIAVSLFPFGVGVKEQTLQLIAPAVIWICVLLASLLSLSRLFEEDFEDGSLTLLWLQGLMPEFLVFAKALAHWIHSVWPMLLLTPVLGMLLHMDAESIVRLVESLLVGTPLLSLIGTLGAALTVGLKRASGLLGLLIFPLFIPVVIFGVGSVSIDDAALRFEALMLLVAMLVVALPVCLPLTAVALKYAVREA